MFTIKVAFKLQSWKYLVFGAHGLVGERHPKFGTCIFECGSLLSITAGFGQVLLSEL